MFQLWKTNIRYKQYYKKSKLLQSKLFLASPNYSKTLLAINKLLYHMKQSIQFIDYNKIEEMELDYFIKIQK